MNKINIKIRELAALFNPRFITRVSGNEECIVFINTPPVSSYYYYWLFRPR